MKTNQLELAERELSFDLRLKDAVWYNHVFGGPFVLPIRPTENQKIAAKRLIWC